MGYSSLYDCIKDLEKTNQLIRIKETVDPELEMAAIHLEAFKNKGPAVFYENIKGYNYPAVSNLFGTIERTNYIFRDQIDEIKQILSFKYEPEQIFKSFFKKLPLILKTKNAFPKKVKLSNQAFREIKLNDIPAIKCWKEDGGAFLTLPEVFSMDPEFNDIMKSNLGMYRIQLNGNKYNEDEIGLHYQIHRGIGIHHKKALKLNKPLKVSIFLGGPPAHIVAAVMPLPENISELMFAGLLNNNKFNYDVVDGYCINAAADFVITGELALNDLKPEGPFGDHLGYYSLKHLFPYLKVHKVYAKNNPVLPFTVVGRPPQEDSQFGAFIHSLTGSFIQNEIQGVEEVNAVDEAGVHPLLLAIGKERYVPYNENQKPQELLTIANRILGYGQLSLAKYLFITSKNGTYISTKNIQQFFAYILQRIDFKRDIHFITKTTIDTLDYTGEGLNEGSKVVFAANGEKKRQLGNNPPFGKLIMDGVVAVKLKPFQNYNEAKETIDQLKSKILSANNYKAYPLVIACDDENFVADNINNFLWVTFTRSNPSHDIYGINENISFKHWSCEDVLIIDARKKPHHAPELILDENIQTKAKNILEKYIK
ncbi:MAG: UbiD family decarboxylase [Vicingaceae bacterium]